MDKEQTSDHDAKRKAAEAFAAHKMATEYLAEVRTVADSIANSMDKWFLAICTGLSVPLAVAFLRPEPVATVPLTLTVGVILLGIAVVATIMTKAFGSIWLFYCHSVTCKEMRSGEDGLDVRMSKKLIRPWVQRVNLIGNLITYGTLLVGFVCLLIAVLQMVEQIAAQGEL